MSSSIYAGRVRTRSCALVIVDNEILLVNQHVPTRDHPIWLPPGGEVNIGETAKEAAIRETLEETGLTINPTRLVAVHEFIEPPFHAVELYFVSELIGGSLETGTDPELGDNDQQILKCEFIPLNQLKYYRLYPDFLRNLGKESCRLLTNDITHIISQSDS